MEVGGWGGGGGGIGDWSSAEGGGRAMVKKVAWRYARGFL